MHVWITGHGLKAERDINGELSLLLRYARLSSGTGETGGTIVNSIEYDEMWIRADFKSASLERFLPLLGYYPSYYYFSGIESRLLRDRANRDILSWEMVSGLSHD
jgi:hypothetical protein